ncbi:hypothetical protein DVH24_034617 [Malus domestica]|uniref:Amino acid transporter transmembrane domain-containing protein n=1 Tax=Malus domestica TaxID=3750 RepID=A0A498IZN0_MALDO|nr:hypothetical protein DVH24_034617 [Malus domestica]
MGTKGMGNHCLSLAFKWQLYTIWLLVQHKSDFGTRCGIYIDLAMTAFGQKLSAGTCVQLIIIGGGTVKLFIKTGCNDGVNCDAKSLTNVECFLLLMCMAIVPNLNYIAWVSLIGATTAIACCTLIWAGRPGSLSCNPPEMNNGICTHSHVNICFLWPYIVGFCTFRFLFFVNCKISQTPIISNSNYQYIPYTNGAMLKAVSEFHGHNTSQHVLGLIYIVIIISCLTTYQIYGMVAFDIMNIKYTSWKKERCLRWLQIVIRLLFGGLIFLFFLISVAFTFLGYLLLLIGGFVSVPLTYKPRLTNMALGCSGLLLSLLFVAAAAWSLNANFFKPS